MRPASKLFLFPLIILLLFSAAPAVEAQTGTTDFTGTITGKAICADPPQNYEDSIAEVGQVDYWEIWLVAGQNLIIDVDAEDIGNLDAYLEVFDESEISIGAHNDQVDSRGNVTSLDPYLEVIAPSDGYYYIAISSATNDSSDISAKGPYKFVVECPDQSSTPEFEWPLEVGYLLGANRSNPGLLVNIKPDTGGSSLPHPLGIGPITDIEFDPSSDSLLVAVEAVGTSGALDYIPARIVQIDRISGNEVESFSLGAESILALEAAAGMLYGVRVDSVGKNYTLVQVTLDASTDPKTAELKDVVSFLWPVQTLAYNQSEKILYGANGTDLVTIDLVSSTAALAEQGLLGLTSGIATLDFSNDDVLYGVDLLGNLFNVPIFSNRQAVIKDEPLDDVTSLTFVVEEAPQNEDPPIKTICSSSFTNQTAASSESRNTPTRFRLKRKSRNSAVGLFKFEGEIGEIVNVSVCLEEKMAIESEKASTPRWIQKLWPKWQPRNRIFVVIRDAIADFEQREKRKGVLTTDEPLKIENVQLRATGSYYIMVIRPFRKFRNFDYCLSLESLNGTADDSLILAWPKDEAEENTPATSVAEKASVVQTNTVTVAGESEENNDPVPVALSTPTIAPTSVSPGETTVEETEEITPIEPTVEPVVKAAPVIPEETEGDDDTEDVPPVEEHAAQVTEEPVVKGAPEITDEASVVVEEKTTEEFITP